MDYENVVWKISCLYPRLKGVGFGLGLLVNYKKELIKANLHYGEPIAKAKIPAEYIQKFGVNNLFWVSLPQDWRMLYTLTANGEVEIVAFVLDIMDHDKYNKKFGYR